MLGNGERIEKEAIVKECDHNLVNVLKENKRMKRAKNSILFLLLALEGWTFWLFMILYLPRLISMQAKVEISLNTADYGSQVGLDAQYL